jgi:hypothetical protein
MKGGRTVRFSIFHFSITYYPVNCYLLPVPFKPGFASCALLLYIHSSLMYGDFRVHDRWTGEEVHCIYQALIVAIATRHADAIDVKFLANGRPVWIALPHPAWVEYNKRTGKVLTDPLAVEIAGHYLKWAIETGEDGGREMYALSVTETLEHLEAVQKEHQQALAATR